MTFENMLTEWLVRQRWFAGKGRDVHDLAVISDTPIDTPVPAGLRHLIVCVSHGTTVDSYQLFLGLRDALPAELEHALIGTYEGNLVYDALHDSELTGPLLDAIASEATIGPLRFQRIEGVEIETGVDSGAGGRAGGPGTSIVLTGEQSNTSLVFGESSILKVFRRLAPGPNPDLEVSAALARLGSPHVAEPLGWIETRLEGAGTVLAILSRYLRAASDGWSLAAASVRDLYATVLASSGGTDQAGQAGRVGGDFAPEAERLGVATAQVHADLAAAFGASELEPDAIRDMAEQMYRRLDLAVAAVPELTRYADMIGTGYKDLAKLTDPIPVQRVHGDYHLSQAMRTQTGWVVLDFEGEPASPLAQRRARSSPLRDVAGMLRSFDYAARHQLITHTDHLRLASAASDWVRRNSTAFTAGYAAAGGLDPAENAVLLRALSLDKAVYEVMYEARHRPSWLPIPLESLAEF
ncbi:MAG TPA: aminoglycoside phosphotransferase [Streptosporangiaceae bacterium]|nr:aminoglycoside phosphotransferase [Streptosporangiaceae bacterium]